MFLVLSNRCLIPRVPQPDGPWVEALAVVAILKGCVWEHQGQCEETNLNSRREIPLGLYRRGLLSDEIIKHWCLLKEKISMIFQNGVQEYGVYS
jgi:hypothetical protein